jgi:hypothetical protein
LALQGKGQAKRLGKTGAAVKHVVQQEAEKKLRDDENDDENDESEK